MTAVGASAARRGCGFGSAGWLQLRSETRNVALKLWIVVSFCRANHSENVLRCLTLSNSDVLLREGLSSRDKVEHHILVISNRTKHACT